MTRLAAASGTRALAKTLKPRVSQRRLPPGAGAWIPGVEMRECLPLMVVLHGCGQNAPSATGRGPMRHAGHGHSLPGSLAPEAAPGFGSKPRPSSSTHSRARSPTSLADMLQHHANFFSLRILGHVGQRLLDRRGCATRSQQGVRPQDHRRSPRSSAQNALPAGPAQVFFK